jgi:hypothetical protein
LVLRPRSGRARGDASASIEPEVVEAVPLDPEVIVISAKSFDARLAQGQEPSPLPTRHAAAVLAASLTDPATAASMRCRR